MSIEEKVFKKKRFLEDKLLDFGFSKDDGHYIYHQNIMDGDFQVELTVSGQELDQVSGRVIDTDLNEEYFGFRVKSRIGSFAGQVQEAYLELLNEIAEKYCQDLAFSSQQANRLVHFLDETFQDALNYPFEKFPSYAAFRYEPLKKWYALLFPLKKEKLDDPYHHYQKEELEEELEVVNIKVAPQLIDELIKEKGIFPSYHMNKKHWVTVTLDDSVTDAKLFEMVKESRRLVVGKQAALESNFWIIPANPKYYDIDQEFAANPIIKWTQKAKIKQGDFVLIYMTNPVGAVRYACRVLESDIDNNGYRKESSIQKLMKIERIKTFSEEDYPLSKLKTYGVKTIRGPRRLPEELVKDIKKELK